jgi:hypothetical protein
MAGGRNQPDRLNRNPPQNKVQASLVDAYSEAGLPSNTGLLAKRPNFEKAT